MAENTEGQEPEAKKGSKLKTIIIGLVGALVVSGGALAALNFFGVIAFGPPTVAAEAEPMPDANSAGVTGNARGPALFSSIHPDLLANFQSDGDDHFLKIAVDIMSRDPKVIAAFDDHQAMIRHNLLLMFQEVSLGDVQTREGIENLRTAALEEIRAVLEGETGESDVEDVYFTSFIVQ